MNLINYYINEYIKYLEKAGYRSIVNDLHITIKSVKDTPVDISVDVLETANEIKFMNTLNLSIIYKDNADPIMTNEYSYPLIVINKNDPYFRSKFELPVTNLEININILLGL